MTSLVLDFSILFQIVDGLRFGLDRVPPLPVCWPRFEAWRRCHPAFANTI